MFSVSTSAVTAAKGRGDLEGLTLKALLVGALFNIDLPDDKGVKEKGFTDAIDSRMLIVMAIILKLLKYPVEAIFLKTLFGCIFVDCIIFNKQRIERGWLKRAMCNCRDRPLKSLVNT